MSRYWWSFRSVYGLIGKLRFAEENGQTTVEYAVVTTFVIIMAFAAFFALRSGILAFFTTLSGRLAAAAASI